MEESVHQLLRNFGVEDSEVLENTPRRFMQAFEELLWARKSNPPELKVFETDSPGELVVKIGLRATSLCPHHCLPFLLEADFGYVPSGRVVGISKPARLLRWVAGRFTLQESIAPDFITEFDKQVKSLGSILVVRGYHLCEALRGSKSPSLTVTYATSGVFSWESPQKREFWRLTSAKPAKL